MNKKGFLMSQIVIIAGPNGAGKTTSSSALLNETLGNGYKP